MNICNHIIADTEVIGIGPLMQQSSNDPATRALYNSKQLWFYLHLRNQSIKIESDWFDVGTSNEPNEEAKQRALFKEFAANYEKAKIQVIGLIPEEVN